jgi:predicted acylesterase/phospholipase RssA
MADVPADHPILVRMRQPGPKKILACDGGGIRGLISVEILAQLEAQLRQKLGQPDLLLGDYFDFISGTSTGGIIATCLSCGMSMDQIRDFYTEKGSSMFQRAKWGPSLHDKYRSEPLGRLLQSELESQLNDSGRVDPAGQEDDDNETLHGLLGDHRLRGLLMLVLRNHSTDSPWPLCNNPLAKYNDLGRKDCNLRLPLWQLVRASTAAPTFFPPEVVKLAEDSEFVFVDGGVTTYNNPAYMAFQMATARPYNINWSTGVDQLLIVSVGTGNAAAARPGLRLGDLWLVDHAKNIPSALMNAATAGWDMVCRVMGECRFGAEVDSEFGDMVSSNIGTPAAYPNWTGPKQFAYVRYDPLTSVDGLIKIGLKRGEDGKKLAKMSEQEEQVAQMSKEDVARMSDAAKQKREEWMAPLRNGLVPMAKNLARMDDVSLIPVLQQVGSAYGDKYVNLDHLKGFV